MSIYASRDAFPLITMHALYEAHAAKVCTLWLYMPEVCVHAYRVLELLMARHVPREHNYITDYDIQRYVSSHS